MENWERRRPMILMVGSQYYPSAMMTCGTATKRQDEAVDHWILLRENAATTDLSA